MRASGRRASTVAFLAEVDGERAQVRRRLPATGRLRSARVRLTEAVAPEPPALPTRAPTRARRQAFTQGIASPVFVGNVLGGRAGTPISPLS